jgi:hypothetical protein
VHPLTIARHRSTTIETFHLEVAPDGGESMIVVNFGHPLTEAQRSGIEQLAAQPVERVIAVPTQFSHDQPFAEQARALIDQIELTPTEWQIAPLLINLPSLNTIAAVVIAELHGRMGYFPAILRLRPVAGSVPPQFEVAEIINLQGIRDAARAGRHPGV